MENTKEVDDRPRCKQCDHLQSFHNDEGCTMKLLGVRAVPLYKCACVCVGNNFSKPQALPFPVPVKYDKKAPVTIPATRRQDIGEARKALAETRQGLQQLGQDLDVLYKALTEKRLRESRG